MKIALTGQQSLLGEGIIRALTGDHTVQLAGTGDLRRKEVCRQLLTDVDVLIHLAPLLPPAGEAAADYLDRITRGTYVLLQEAVAAGVQRVILGSSLDLFERYPASWAVAETWAPRPDVDNLAALAAYLAEESCKQIARTEPLSIICLRFGTVVSNEIAREQPYDPRWLHVEDAVQAVHRALSVSLKPRTGETAGRSAQGWWVFHIPGSSAAGRFPLGGAGEESTLGYHPTARWEEQASSLPKPTADERAGDLALLAPRKPVASRPIRNVVLFGAGGPLAAAAARVLAPSYCLRLTDIRPIAAVAAEAKPQSLGAPLPEVLATPHEALEVDVTIWEQVQRSCMGMDAVVNCTVVRQDPVEAFRVNVIGAYHVMAAAVAAGIRRIVHTGPQLVTMDRPAGYWWDFGVPDEAPGRTGTWLYGHTKYLGQEIVRLFAEQYDLEVPVLLFSSFVDPATAKPHVGGVHPMTVSWEDAAHAVRCALEAPELPSPCERFHILADLPHGKYTNVRAKRLLGWQPQDNLVHLWARRPEVGK
ncbi:MAG: NAD-dependent epimerase/dehydratase family protein [Chloroflexi bacterium]|nr:NAD-dependent epimerase/dehydratase family protein [Chloroflexota bacterium]